MYVRQVSVTPEIAPVTGGAVISARLRYFSLPQSATVTIQVEVNSELFQATFVSASAVSETEHVVIFITPKSLSGKATVYIKTLPPTASLGAMTTTNVILPAPTVSVITTSGVNAYWAAFTASEIGGYSVQYKMTLETEWVTLKSIQAQAAVTLVGLSPGNSYTLRVAIVEKDMVTVGAWSDASEEFLFPRSLTFSLRVYDPSVDIVVISISPKTVSARGEMVALVFSAFPVQGEGEAPGIECTYKGSGDLWHTKLNDPQMVLEVSTLASTPSLTTLAVASPPVKSALDTPLFCDVFVDGLDGLPEIVSNFTLFVQGSGAILHTLQPRKAIIRCPHHTQ